MTDEGKKYLSDILRAIEMIEQFTLTTVSFNDYLADLKTQSAVERQLGIIGEAVNKFDKIHPELTLENARKIVGFRNRLIHTYDAVDSSMIWAILKNHVSPLKAEIYLLRPGGKTTNNTINATLFSFFLVLLKERKLKVNIFPVSSGKYQRLPVTLYSLANIFLCKNFIGFQNHV
jgi:uncharacterized protein with HEPN domain